MSKSLRVPVIALSVGVHVISMESRLVIECSAYSLVKVLTGC